MGYNEIGAWMIKLYCDWCLNPLRKDEKYNCIEVKVLDEKTSLHHCNVCLETDNVKLQFMDSRSKDHAIPVVLKK